MARIATSAVSRPPYHDRFITTAVPRPPIALDNLLERMRAGDSTAFDEIFRAWYAPLVRLAEGMLRERAVAEEIVQDVLLEFWRRREQLAVDGSPQAYLFQSTRNRALNHLRHARVKVRAEPLVIGEVTPRNEPSADALLVEQEIETALRAAVSDLPPRCREVFELSRVHGLKYAEIAGTLGVSVKAVEAQMGKALRVLRERLAPWLPKGGRL
jgi:RNA polymerase sigma-70 factor, ECF subfamily